MSAGSKVVIIGAGPSGIAAASVMQQFGLDLVVLDEQQRAGGQFLRQPPRQFTVDRWLQSALYAAAKSALRGVEERQGIDWRFGTTALGVLRASSYRRAAGARCAHEIWLQGPFGCEMLPASAVLLAAGCYERPLGFPGWTLPGVMGAGAIQGFVKSQQFVPGDRFVLAGSHPLQLVVADQLIGAGAAVSAVLFTQQRRHAAGVLQHPVTMLRHGLQLLEIANIFKRLKRARVPVLFGHTILAAEGGETVKSATIAALGADGKPDRTRTHVIACDRIGICHGFLASSELARQAGATVRWSENEGGWLVNHDEWFESSELRLFVAGEVTGVAGADAALEKGHIAGVGILLALGRIDLASAQQLAAQARRRLRRIGRFASLLNRLAEPPPNLAHEAMSEDTILCRCESITRGDFRRRLAEHPDVTSADAAKLLTRVGMGMCQGRLCGDHVARFIARERGVPVTEVGPFHAQVPVKPVLLDCV